MSCPSHIEMRTRAREMRLAGRSYREIQQEVSVSKGTLSLWLRDVTLSPEQKDRITRLSDWGRQKGANKKRDARIEAQGRIAEKATQEIGILSARELLIAGAILYWAEGSKDKPWRRSEDVTFINSDPGLVRVFLAWLEMLGIPKERLAFRLSIHDTADLGRATTYWADLVGVAPDRFWNPSIKNHKVGTNRRNVGDNYHGCLIIRVRRGTGLYRRIAGWMEGVVQGLGQSTRATRWPVV